MIIAGCYNNLTYLLWITVEASQGVISLGSWAPKETRWPGMAQTDAYEHLLCLLCLYSRSLLGPLMREPPPTNARLSVNFQDNIARGDKSMTPLQFAAPITADCRFVIRRLISSTSPIRATELPKLAAAACTSTGQTV